MPDQASSHRNTDYCEGNYHSRIHHGSRANHKSGITGGNTTRATGGLNSASAVDWVNDIGGDLSVVGMFGGASVKRIHRPTGKGNNGDITVEVTVKDGNIISVSLKEHAETEGLYEAAEKNVTADIIKTQSTDVDSVTGK